MWGEWLTATPPDIITDACPRGVNRAVCRQRPADAIKADLLASGMRTPGTLVSSTVSSRGVRLIHVFAGTVPSGFHEGMTAVEADVLEDSADLLQRDGVVDRQLWSA